MSRAPATLDRARAIASAFGDPPRHVAPLGKGLINDTFAVDTDRGQYVLQRVHPVFPPEIHLNIEAATEHLAALGMVTPRLVATPQGRPWLEEDGEVWRMMTRIHGVSFDAVQEPAQAHAAGELLGRFHSALASLPKPLLTLRAGVHDTPLHLRRLREAVSAHAGHRLLPQVQPLADAIEARAATLPPLSGLPPRVVHGDPKLNNILFESADGPGRLRPVCLIDLDTVAPMALALELGDAWRSWCNPRGEDEQQARFDLATFEASAKGYASGCSLPLSAEERESLLHGVEWITLELSARFAADALVEAYFGWDPQRFAGRGEHNLVRAQGQWSLHEAVLRARPDRARILRAGP